MRLGVILSFLLGGLLVHSAQAQAIPTSISSVEQPGQDKTTVAVTFLINTNTGPAQAVQFGQVNATLYYNSTYQGQTCSVTVEGGQATCNLYNELGAGNYQVVFTYQDPSGTYGPSNGSSTFYAYQ